MVNLFGHGFIGKEYSSKYNCIVNTRDNLIPKHNKILYFISTVDNYNIYTNPYLDIETNLITLINVLENARKKFNSNFEFNFISSWFVYGETDLPATENSVCSPKGFYSITKKAAEDLLISYCNTYSIKYRILRLANILGKTDNKVSKKKNALQYLINEIKNNNKIELYYEGMFYRDYMDVEDVVQAINLVINNGQDNDIYNIGNGDPILFKDIIQYIVNKTNSSSEIIMVNNKDFHGKIQVKSMYMDNSKLKSLGFKKNYSIFETLDKLI